MQTPQPRPMYENEKSLSAEEAFIQSIEQKWHIEARKFPISERLDYHIYRRGILRAIVELKCRTNKASKYPTYMISEGKVKKGLALSQKYNVPFLLCVRFTDADKFAVIEECVIACYQIGGRTDRNDPLDKEMVAHIDMRYFVDITEIKYA